MDVNSQLDIEVAFKGFLAAHHHLCDAPLIINSPRKFDQLDCPNKTPGNKKVSYFIRTNEDGNAYGFAQCFAGCCDFKNSWAQRHKSPSYAKLSHEETRTRLKEIFDKQREDIGEKLRKESEAAKTAEADWIRANSNDVSNLEYVKRKKFIPIGLKKWGDVLLVPLRDAENTLHNIERIYENGDKRPIVGGRVNGLFHLFGEINPTETIQLCEGVATAATVWEATNVPTACCRNAGNLAKVAQIIRGKYPNIKIVVCCDDDKFKLEQARRKARAEGRKPPAKNAGISAALQICNEFSAKVATPDFSEFGNDDHFINQIKPPSDFNDLFIMLLNKGLNRNDALAEVRRQISRTNKGRDIMTDTEETAKSNETWPEPELLHTNIEHLEYPTDALPKVIYDAVMEVHKFTQAPIALIASSAISALSLACQAHINVERTSGLVSPAGLFLLTIADSGERKSTCDKFFTDEIRKYEKDQLEIAKPLLDEYTAASEAWGAKKNGLLDKIKNAIKSNKPTDELEHQLEDHERNKPEPVKIPRFLFTDATPEGLAMRLKSWPSAGLICAEAGAVFGAHAMNKDSIMRTLSQQNKLWDGAVLEYDRKSTESLVIHNARLTQHLQVQEDTLHEFLDRSGKLVRGIGYLARFLISWPKSTQGSRLFTEAPSDWPALNDFNRHIANILKRTTPINIVGELEPVTLTLSEAAKEIWIEFHDFIEKEIAIGGDFYDIRDAASKIADNATRLAALFHYFNNGEGTINSDNIESASRISLWHLHEASRFFSELSLPIELSNSSRLSLWLIEYCLKYKVNEIPRRDIQRLVTPIRLRQKGALDAALQALEIAGHLKQVSASKRKTFQINPLLLKND